jgi:D-alanyl-lipoteichoic acid acyltransferase DltB (MBOAT superfamily)
VTLAIQQGSNGNLPLFLHVLGATMAFGAILALVVLGFAARRAETERALWLRRLAFRIGLFVLLPTWILMRVGAQWIDGKEYPHGHEPGWVGVGFLVSDFGALIVLALLILSWFGSRRYESRAGAVVPWLAALYAVALGVAWFAMSAKPGGGG